MRRRRPRPARSVAHVACAVAAVCSKAAGHAMDQPRSPADSFFELRGSPLLVQHFACAALPDGHSAHERESLAVDVAGASPVLSAEQTTQADELLREMMRHEGCRPPVDSWFALLEAERAGLHLVQTATVPPFLPSAVTRASIPTSGYLKYSQENRRHDHVERVQRRTAHP